MENGGQWRLTEAYGVSFIQQTKNIGGLRMLGINPTAQSCGFHPAALRFHTTR